jgi:hypothetical protein
MASSLFIAWNASTSALTGTTTMAGTATSVVSGTPKTILQVAPGSKIAVVEFGYILTSTPSAPLQIDLIETDTVFATVSAGSIAKYNNPGGPATAATTGTSATGYNASAEGTITATRLLAQNYDSAPFFKQQFPLGREPEVLSGKSLRVRVTPTTAAATTVMAYVIWAEG